ALFGRKINQAENQLAFIHFLRLIADGELSAEEAVRAYHGVLQKLRVRPHRSLEDDLQLQTNVMNYAGNGVTRSVPAAGKGLAKKTAPQEKNQPPCACQCAAAVPEKPQAAGATRSAPQDEPDFTRMTAAQKVAFHKARWDRILG